MLLFLIERRERLVLKEELLDGVWRDTFVTPNALTRVIAQLRKALGRRCAGGARHRDRAAEGLSLPAGRSPSAPSTGRRRQPSPPVAATASHGRGVVRRPPVWRVTLPLRRRRLSGADRLELAAIRARASAAGAHRSRAGDDGVGLRGRSVDLPRRTPARLHGRGERVQRDLRAAGRRRQPDPGHERRRAERRIGVVARRRVHRVSLAGQGRHLDRSGVRRVVDAGGDARVRARMVARRIQARVLDLRRCARRAGDDHDGASRGRRSAGGRRARARPRRASKPGVVARWPVRRVLLVRRRVGSVAVDRAATGGEPTRVAAGIMPDRIAFTPDGRTVCWSGMGPSANVGIWCVRLDQRSDSRAVAVLQGVPGTSGLSIARDGTIAYATSWIESDLWSLPLSPAGQASGRPAPLLRDTSRNTYPAFSPDGRYLAFLDVAARQPVGSLAHEHADAGRPSSSCPERMPSSFRRGCRTTAAC